MPYFTPIEILETRFEVKKSVFHARAGLAKNRTEAMELLEACKKDYPDARHHCWGLPIWLALFSHQRSHV